MRPWKERTVALRGRLHGRLLKILGVVAVLTAAAAVWQFSILIGDDRTALPDLSDEALTEEQDGGFGVSDGASASPAESASPTAGPVEASSSPAPSAPATSAPASSADVEPERPRCTATLTLDSEWSDSISVIVEVANTGEDSFDGWEVVLDIKHVEVTSTWGMDHVEGDRYANMLLNGSLGPGDTTEPSFQADTTGRVELPETVPCTPSA